MNKHLLQQQLIRIDLFKDNRKYSNSNSIEYKYL